MSKTMSTRMDAKMIAKVSVEMKLKKGEEKESMYPNINMRLTGMKLKRMFARAGYDVKSIQKYLHLSCPQPIYRWFKGKALPSVDHLYALSVLLGVHMEELIVSDRGMMRCAEMKWLAPDRSMVCSGEMEWLVPDRSMVCVEERVCEVQKFRRLYCYYERVSKCA